MTNINECPNHLEVRGDALYRRHFGAPTSAVRTPDGNVVLHFRPCITVTLTGACEGILLGLLLGARSSSPDLSGIAYLEGM